MAKKLIKRDGRLEPVNPAKINSRIKRLCYGFDRDFVDHTQIAEKTLEGIFDGMTTLELDKLAAEVAASMTTEHPDFAMLASRIAISTLHKCTKKRFSDVIEALHEYVKPKNKQQLRIISDEIYSVVMNNKERLDSAIIYDRDFDYSYFGFKTLERSYLLRLDGKTVERPQHMLMRVAVNIHKNEIEEAIQVR